MRYNPDYWIELTRDYHTTMAARRTLLATHPSKILFQTPSPACALAARELLETSLQFLCARYPQHFALTDANTRFHNRLLRTTTDLRTADPLHAIFAHIPEDYALMLRSEDDGRYYLRAAAVCSSVGWHVAQHRDASLAGIHGEVPGVGHGGAVGGGRGGRMAVSMDRWFARLGTDAPVSRCSWSLEDWEVMFASGEGDGLPGVRGKEWERSRFRGREGELKVRDIRLRCDVQTLRRLPVSGAVVFNFKAVFTPLEELRDEPFVPALLGKVLKEGNKELVGYKCEEHVRRVAIEALDQWSAEQVQKGAVPADWEVTTLDESPFYPGWEEKWRRQQGMAT